MFGIITVLKSVVGVLILPQMRGEKAMPITRTKISEQFAIDLILEQLAGMTREEIADLYGVLKRVVSYHEKKDLTQELKMVLLIRAAEVPEAALGQRALEKNRSALPQTRRGGEDETDFTNLSHAGDEDIAYRWGGKNGHAPLGRNGDHTDCRRLGLMQSKGYSVISLF